MSIKRIRNAGDIDKLKIKVWRMVLRAEKMALDENSDDKIALRSIHACIQAGAVYMKILEATDLEERIKRLEELYELKQTG